MAHIIDNVKVGQFIKSLLKDKHMTQDQLAEHLKITKSAVSQNLNGKSFFDMQNLIHIAELFHLTLEDILQGKYPDDISDTDAEYVRMIKRGLVEFKAIDPKQFHLTEPDIYGKLFTDYLIEGKQYAWLAYLIEKRIPFVNQSYHRYQRVLEQLIIDVMQYQITSPLPLIELFLSTIGQFTFQQPHDYKSFLHLLDQDASNLATILFTSKTVYRKKHYIFGVTFKTTLNHYWIDRAKFIQEVIELHLNNLWQVVLTHHVKEASFFMFESLLSKLIRRGYIDGLVSLVETMRPMKSYEVYHVDAINSATVICLQAQLPQIVDMMITKNLVASLYDLLDHLIAKAYLDYVSHLIAIKADKLQAKKVIKSVLQHQALSLLEQHPSFFNEDVLSYGLDTLPINLADKSTLQKLVSLGAKFKPEYYNRFTSEKMSRLINKTKNGHGYDA